MLMFSFDMTSRPPKLISVENIKFTYVRDIPKNYLFWVICRFFRSNQHFLSFLNVFFNNEEDFFMASFLVYVVFVAIWVCYWCPNAKMFLLLMSPPCRVGYVSSMHMPHHELIQSAFNTHTHIFWDMKSEFFCCQSKLHKRLYCQSTLFMSHCWHNSEASWNTLMRKMSVSGACFT